MKNIAPHRELDAPVARSQSRECRIALGVLLFALTVFRVWYAGRHDLMQDEAYYWQWSRHLAWGYYDNTPLVAVAIRFFTAMLGNSELGVRAEAIFCAVVASLFIYLLAARLFGERLALFAVILANIVPLFAAGAVIATHDPVQLALWAAALYIIQRALTDRPRWWYAAGIVAGLAALAKLNALFLLPSVLLYIDLSPTARERWLRRPEPYIAGLIALLIFSPFVWWNHTHQNAFWIHIHAMGSRGDTDQPPLKWTLRFLGAQALVLSPFVFLTYLYTLYDGWRRGFRQRDDAILYLWCTSIVVFAATIFVSLRSKVEANWAVAAYISGLILVAMLFAEAWKSRRKLAKPWVGVNIGVAAFLAVVALCPAVMYSVGVKFHKSTDDRTNDLYGWRALGQRLRSEQIAMGGDPFVFGINYRMPSEAAFYLPGQPRTYSLFLHDRANEYMFWENQKKLIGRNAIFINDSDSQDHFDALRAVFTRIEPQAPFYAYRNPPYSTPIRTIQIVRCYGFKGYDVKAWQQGW